MISNAQIQIDQLFLHHQIQQKMASTTVHTLYGKEKTKFIDNRS
jgi:hypothetical protein